jgi:hypothetical protein
MGNQKIIFTNVLDFEINYKPIPSYTSIPEWYKETSSYISGEKIPDPTVGDTVSTIKKCMPVFDAMTAGYIIPTYVDLYVSKREDGPYYMWPSTEPISFHSIIQAEKYPKNNGFSYPKWINPWSIKTPKGYSSLFIPPMHSDNNFFSILPGIVDTDVYSHPVNFPFILNDINFEGLIPAGTPMVQVIPFKRDAWKMSFGGDKEKTESINQNNYSRSRFFDSYKTLFRQKKEYR